MSLAMFAAPFDDNNETLPNNSDNNIINKKRRTHCRTQKIYPKENFDTNKVNNVLEQIHNNLDSDDDDKDTFNPPPMTESVGVQKTKPLDQKEQMTNMTSTTNSTFRTFGRAPQPNYEGSDNLDLNDYGNYGDKKSNEEYYKRVMPGYNPEKTITEKSVANRPYYNTVNYTIPETSSSPDVLLQKLNYMINLLEEQQDERTNNVTEEVVLYSFLGIFIIFIADTFVRAGKYVR
jgi:hypothetical protein